MARWQPDAAGRLQAAAYELFRERGFEQTTVTDIAARAGLDKRTFYRIFGDKREVLFRGGQELEDRTVELVAAAGNAAESPLGSVVAAIEQATGERFAEMLEPARARQAIIASSPELTERELLKMVSLARALGAALRDKGVPETAAVLAAESGVTIFRVAFSRWFAPGNTTPLADLVAATATDLHALR
jgi:AcrR family transcriptional regulator